MNVTDTMRSSQIESLNENEVAGGTVCGSGAQSGLFKPRCSVSRCLDPVS